MDTLARNQQHQQALERLLGIKSTRISRPFWWESNACWGEVTHEADWLAMVCLWVEHRMHPLDREQTLLSVIRTEAANAQVKMLEGKCASMDGDWVLSHADRQDAQKRLISFGFRCEHIDGEITLGDWLTQPATP
jgi:hypothetical protein